MLQSVAQRFSAAPMIAKLNASRVSWRRSTLEPDVEKLSDDQLRARTDEFREKYKTAPIWATYCPMRSQRRKPPNAPRAATLRVQMLGGMVLHQGKFRDAYQRG